MENEDMTTITRKFRVSADQMSQAARECAGTQIPVTDEGMEAIFNVSSADTSAGRRFRSSRPSRARLR